MAETSSLSITARLADGASLPPGAVLEVELLDVSRADAPSIRLSSLSLEPASLPLPIELPYDSAAIDPRMTYVVAARVRSAGAVVLRTTTAHQVLTRGASERVEIVLEPTERRPAVATQRITGVPWGVTEIAGRALVSDDPPTIAFREDGTFSMYAGCNRFRGQASLSNERIAFPDPIAGTRRLCAPPLMRLEREVLDALRRSVGYQRTGRLLAFTNEDGAVTMRFQERPE